MKQGHLFKKGYIDLFSPFILRTVDAESLTPLYRRMNLCLNIQRVFDHLFVFKTQVFTQLLPGLFQWPPAALS